jgi:hypothetical protein
MPHWINKVQQISRNILILLQRHKRNQVGGQRRKHSDLHKGQLTKEWCSCIFTKRECITRSQQVASSHWWTSNPTYKRQHSWYIRIDTKDIHHFIQRNTNVLQTAQQKHIPKKNSYLHLYPWLNHQILTIASPLHG